ncbi:hypothetical protein [Pseudomonas chlororaphis]|uniref:hypothetical protein n=1 Tax=Pseudomonas chlororaphis TaxID=587753 RepID=UPI001B3151B7|nr:hypothetical protein [Pseudomonas chlororaphis]MBP5057715.1 hypothetical protein [Pseudomonas chlororaphis]MBP5139536.1 hypothetical protein [Pseudomonas chlororaphis]QTU03081.1 hypothetical protein HUT26_28695 [Pseudomonas chlororaphis]
MNDIEIVDSFFKKYADFWRNGARDVQSVYTPDAILCGYEIIKSRDKVATLLGSIYGQGFTEIIIEPLEISSSPDAILIACKYSAKRGEETMAAKSSYVLVDSDGDWKIAMHTAT